MKRVIAGSIAGLVALTALFGVTQTASAAKPEPFLIELDCGADGDFVVEELKADADWTPVHVVGGGTLIPVAFANRHFTFTDPTGHTEEFSDPDIAKAGPAKRDLLHCHFEIMFEDASGTFTHSADVTGFIAGR